MADSTVRHQWLDLLEADGPFLSRPALVEELDDKWPRRLDRDTRTLIAPDDPTPAATWPDTTETVDRLLTDVLGYEPGKTLDTSGTYVPHRTHDGAGVHVHTICTTTKGDPRMVVITDTAAAPSPAQLEPGTRVHDHGWRSTPVDRGAMAARHVGADLALVTDGHRHLIVWVGSGMVGWGYIDPKNYRLDRRLADATVGLLSAARITSRRKGESTADLLRASEAKQADLTDKLGIQVRRAAEALVNAVSRTNRDTDGRLLEGIDGRTVYAGVVTVLMRTVFLLNAEEQGLIGDGDLYEQSYALSTLLDRLDEDHYRHPGVMRHRHGAWARILATTRAVHSGVNAPKTDPQGNVGEAMHVYQYGGGLFDPTRHPFLEGITRDGTNLRVGVVDDFTVRHVLDLLQRLDGQRLSYRTFSVEQIGQVYEYLLDHSAVTVGTDEVILGLTGPKGREPEVALGDLEANHNTDAKLAKWLADNHDTQSGKNRDKVWLRRIGREVDDRVASTVTRACRGNTALLHRIEPYLSLLDADARGDAKVFLPGDVYVTETSARGDSGTSYTPPDFAAEIAKHALRHLVYDVELTTDDDPDRGLKAPDEILKLNVCDPAVGSGAILVAAVRYLADRLHAARIEHGHISPDSDTTAAEVLDTTDDRVQARRDIVANCMYAVDRDPMAVEMTKLSLWLITMAHNRPFTFIDHAIRCGDSLLGVTDLGQLRRLHLDPEPAVDLAKKYPLEHNAYLERIDTVINDAIRLRHQVQAGDLLDAKQAAQRAEIAAHADAAIDQLRPVADALVATCYANASGKKGATEAAIANDVITPVIDDDTDRLRQIGLSRPDDCTTDFDFFHWALEFPEVIGNGGFDAMVGNPPFITGTGISTVSGDNYYSAVQRYVTAGEETGRANLAVFFMRRTAVLAGRFAMVLVNSLRDGDSRKHGYLALIRAQWTLYRAWQEVEWTGRDSLHVSLVWASRSGEDRKVLVAHGDASEVAHISSRLGTRRSADLTPFSLSSQPYASGGYKLDSPPLVVDATHPVVARSQFARPYWNAADALAAEEPGKYALDLYGLSEDDVRELEDEAAILQGQQQHVDKRPKSYNSWKGRWWEFWRPRSDLRDAIEQAGVEEVIVVAEVSKHGVPTFLPAEDVWSHSLVVFPSDDLALFAVLHSEFIWLWNVLRSRKMDTRLTFSIKNCVRAFPFPNMADPELDRLGGEIRRLRDDLTHRFGGVTPVMNAVHDSSNGDESVRELRSLLQELNSHMAGTFDLSGKLRPLGFHAVEGREARWTYSQADVDRIADAMFEENLRRYSKQTGKPLDQVRREAQGG